MSLSYRNAIVAVVKGLPVPANVLSVDFLLAKHLHLRQVPLRMPLPLSLLPLNRVLVLLVVLILTRLPPPPQPRQPRQPPQPPQQSLPLSVAVVEVLQKEECSVASVENHFERHPIWLDNIALITLVLLRFYEYFPCILPFFYGSDYII